MNKPLSIKTTEEILKLRNLLQQISHLSFSFSKLNQTHPLDNLGEAEADQLTSAYINLLLDAEKIVKEFKELYIV